MTRRPRDGRSVAHDQAGTATVWATAWILVFALVAGVGGVLGVAASRQHHVDGAADLTALSAAQVLQRGGDACSTAREVAVANQVVLSSCRTVRDDVLVVVRERLALPFGWHPWLSGRARAGPE